MNNKEEISDKITAMKVITYDLNIAKEALFALNNEMPTEEELMDYIHQIIKEDFSCGYGHEADLDDILIIDENGLQL